MIKHAVLITSGDLRLAANQTCWPAQAALEQRLTQVFASYGCDLSRAFRVDYERDHGFIDSQRMGMNVFRDIDPPAPLVFATAAWQYTHHVLPGMRSHRGPILTIANWSGKWPGLVGLLNLNGSLIKAGVQFSTLWSEDFTDAFALNGIETWLQTGRVEADTRHVQDLTLDAIPKQELALGRELAEVLLREKVILGVFDEGCMGMYNAIIDDELLNPAGFFKERLSQSSLYAAMRLVSPEEAGAVREWLERRGLRFITGENDQAELTDGHILDQCRMYIAAVRIAHDFGCDAIGIQYQQGLKDLCPASDLVEGLLNNPDRPPVYAAEGGQELYPQRALPHFNEVDECAGVDAVITNRCWTACGLDPSTTLHDVRWGEVGEIDGQEEFVWLWQISGAAPASHFADGYAGSFSERQPSMYFPRGGGTLRGFGRPGEIVWSRVFVEEDALHADLGRARVVALPAAEAERRRYEVTPQWPLVSVVLHKITRDQFMARHRANHVSIAYAEGEAGAKYMLALKAAIMTHLGIRVHLCGSPLD